MSATQKRGKLAAKVEQTLNYLQRNRGFVVSYAERHRHGEPIATGFVGSAVNAHGAIALYQRDQSVMSADDAVGGERGARYARTSDVRATAAHGEGKKVHGGAPDRRGAAAAVRRPSLGAREHGG